MADTTPGVHVNKHGASITCPVCGMTSHHPDDVRYGYCGNCHDFTGEPMTFVFYPGDAAFGERVRDKVRRLWGLPPKDGGS